MLSENIRIHRKAKGLSQEELACKLNVVRQTVSKWEKGLSVPDSEMLIRISECLDTSVSVLLGEHEELQNDSSELKILAAKLEVLNDQFAKAAETRRKTWRIIFVIIGLLSAFWLIEAIKLCLPELIAGTISGDSIGIIGGADGPTSIIVSRSNVRVGLLIMPILIGAAALIGIVKTKNR